MAPMLIEAPRIENPIPRRRMNQLLTAVEVGQGRIQTTADVPGMNLSFQTCPEECAPTQGRAIDHVGFEVDDLGAFAERLEARGVEFQVEPRYVDSIELTIAFFTDPSGVRIELTEGFDEY